MQLFTKTNFDFVGKRYYAYGFSLFLLAAGLVSLASKKGPHLGIDFTGGSLVQMAFLKPVPLNEIRSVLTAAGYGDAELQESLGSNSVMIRIQRGKASADTLSRD